MSFLRDLALAIIVPILLLVIGAGLFVLGAMQGWQRLMYGGGVVFLVGGIFIWLNWLGMD
jgi:hypothetical protein